MPIYGPRYPGTVTTSGSGDSSWYMPSRAGAEDASYTDSVIFFGEATDYLIATNFGFGIPAGDVLTGLKVEVKLYRDPSPIVQYYGARFYLAGVQQGSDITTNGFFSPLNNNNWPVTATVVSCGSDVVIPGPPTGLTVADLNDPGFGIGVRGANGGIVTSVYVDYIRMTAYTVGVSGKFLMPNQVLQ